ncbi:MAG: ribosomal RNA small subunit methyltransferase A [Clostridiales bacterium]|nr:ribosomal RNA small subunit methyltransferase A [Clostridiales bacterium]
MKKSYQKAHQRKEGVNYKHDLGQHFLYDEALLSALVKSTGVTGQDKVLEIGPGSGMLTYQLCKEAAQVTAVEVDEDVLPFLRMKTQEFDNLTIVVGDIRKQPIRELCAPLGEDFYVIANIPYNITTPILDLLWESGLSIRQLSLMVQKEVADKLLALPGDSAYGLLSARCRYYAEPELEAVVPAEAFTPPPKVDSAFIHLRMRREPVAPVANEKLLMRMMRDGFNHRRKTLTNALKGTVDSEKLLAAMEAEGLKPTARAEELSVESWIALANACAV